MSQRRALLVMLGWLVLGWAIWAVAYLGSADRNADGGCAGIGWGCTLTPKDTLLFAGVLAGVPLTLGVLVIGGIWIGRRRSSGSALWQGTVAVLVGIVGSVLVGGAFAVVARLLG